jgi:hypothetical protein
VKFNVTWQIFIITVITANTKTADYIIFALQERSSVSLFCHIRLLWCTWTVVCHLLTPFLNVALKSALCNLQICLFHKFTFKPPPPPPPPLLLLLLLYHMKYYVVPQGSVLRPLHFNIVWCGLPVAYYIILLRAIVSS